MAPRHERRNFLTHSGRIPGMRPVFHERRNKNELSRSDGPANADLHVSHSATMAPHRRLASCMIMAIGVVMPGQTERRRTALAPLRSKAEELRMTPFFAPARSQRRSNSRPSPALLIRRRLDSGRRSPARCGPDERVASPSVWTREHQLEHGGVVDHAPWNQGRAAGQAVHCRFALVEQVPASRTGHRRRAATLGDRAKGYRPDWFLGIGRRRSC